MDDLISRREAIEWCLEGLNNMPSEQPEQQWMPCSERPPEEQDEYYITWTSPICKGRRFVSITEYCIPRTGEEPYWDLSEHISFYEDAEVLAWMPLPEPWKGEQP